MKSDPEKRDDLGPRDIDVLDKRLRGDIRRQKRIARVSIVAAPTLALFLVVVMWEFGVRQLNVSTLVLPPPSIVALEIVTNAPLLARHGIVTLTEIVAGYSLSVLLGIPMALVVFFSPVLSRALYPLIVSSQLVPKTAIAPLFVVWFGFGLLPKVIITFLIAFFPIVISTIVGLQSIEREKIFLARSMGMGAVGTFWRIRLPHAAPSIFAGLKIAITLAVIGAIVGEFVGSDSGLGYLLLVANGNLDTPLLLAAVVVLTVLGMLSFGLVAVAERVLIPWSVSQRAAALPQSI